LLIKLLDQGALTTLGGGHDAGTLIKLYNAQSSTAAQIQGGKRVSILNLLAAPRMAVKRMLGCISKVSADGSPWGDDVWSKKHLLPGHSFRHANALWSRLLSVSDASFDLMIEWQASACERKLPQARRRLDKSALDEAAHIASLLVGMKEEVSRQYNVTDEAWTSTILDPLLKHGDQNLILALQDLIHSKPDTLNFNEIYGISDLIATHVNNADTKCLGSARTVIMTSDIERSEFELFAKKVTSDIQAVELYHKKRRYFPTICFSLDLRVTYGSLRDRFVITYRSLAYHFGIPYGSLMDHFWDRFGVTYGSLCDNPGVTFEVTLW
jgi:hypothetical protein